MSQTFELEPFPDGNAFSERILAHRLRQPRPVKVVATVKHHSITTRLHTAFDTQLYYFFTVI